MHYNPMVEDKAGRDVPAPEDIEHLLPKGYDSLFRKDSRRTPAWVSVVLIPLISLCFIGLGILIGSHWTSTRFSATCLENAQNYSPIQKEVDTTYHTVLFNGSFMHENNFRREAGPEVDAAWASLGVHLRGLALPVSEAKRSGIQPDQVQINPKYGGGYPVNVEGLHHLHCLNLVRQSLYYNIDYYRAQGKGAFVNSDMIVKHHVSHCLDIVRQQLMCQVDTGVLGQVWWDPEAPKAFVDFNTEHKCKNFDAIRQWAEERQLPETVPKDYLLPPKEGDRIYEEIP